MRTIGPSVKVTRWHTSAGANGGKILVVRCGRPIFTDRIKTEDSAKKKPHRMKGVLKRKLPAKKKPAVEKQPTLRDKIQGLEGVFFFMHRSNTETADDHTLIIRLCPGADPHEVECAIRRVIATHHGWMTSRPNPEPEEEFWRGAPVH